MLLRFSVQSATSLRNEFFNLLKDEENGWHLNPGAPTVSDKGAPLIRMVDRIEKVDFMRQRQSCNDPLHQSPIRSSTGKGMHI
jgi:hypothetical protein